MDDEEFLEKYGMEHGGEWKKKGFEDDLEEELLRELEDFEDDLDEFEDDFDDFDFGYGTELLSTELEVMPRPEMSLVTTIAYSTLFVFLVAAFVAAALYEPKQNKVTEMTEVVIDVDAKPTKKAIKKSLKAIMKNNNTKASLIQ